MSSTADRPEPETRRPGPKQRAAELDGIDPGRIYEAGQFFFRAGIGAAADRTAISAAMKQSPDSIKCGTKKVFATGLQWLLCMQTVKS